MSTASDMKTRVARVLAEEVAPALHMDGADVEVLDVTDGVVQVRLHGACAGCPSTTYTIIMLIEQELRQRVPGIDYLEVTGE